MTAAAHPAERNLIVVNHNVQDLSKGAPTAQAASLPLRHSCWVRWQLPEKWVVHDTAAAVQRCCGCVPCCPVHLDLPGWRLWAYKCKTTSAWGCASGHNHSCTAVMLQDAHLLQQQCNWGQQSRVVWEAAAAKRVVVLESFNALFVDRYRRLCEIARKAREKRAGSPFTYIQNCCFHTP